MPHDEGSPMTMTGNPLTLQLPDEHSIGTDLAAQMLDTKSRITRVEISGFKGGVQILEPDPNEDWVISIFFTHEDS